LDPRNLNGLHAKMDATVPDWTFAKAPIDVAAHDLLGKALDVPVYQLLGGRLRDRVPMIWPIGGGSPEANAAEATAAVDGGYRSLHIKLGALAPETDVARVGAIRAAVGPDIPLMLDVNQGWDRTTALRTIPQLVAFNLSMIEQPIKAWDREGMALLQSKFSTPISADESLHSTRDAMDLVRSGGARVFSLKTGKLGGLLRTRQVAAVAEAAGIPCFVNSMIEMGISVAASLHLAATVPNLVDHGHALMSNLRITEDILVEGSFKYDGRDILVPPGGAGLGVEIDEAKLEERTVDRFVLDL
jgi:muconate cycloisomerase